MPNWSDIFLVWKVEEDEDQGKEGQNAAGINEAEDGFYLWLFRFDKASKILSENTHLTRDRQDS